VATQAGQVLRIPLSPFRTPSTRNGRKFCKLSSGDKVVGVELISDATSLFLASREARVLHFAIKEIPVLNGAGKGVRGIKLEPKDALLGFTQMQRPSDCLRVQTTADKTLTFGQMKYQLTSRGGRGIKTSHRSGFTHIIRPEIQLIDWTQMDPNA
ncbi:MAG: DNA topoisomerase, partial [Planctomycetaceae bacterium]|nr:DNA topoisomerase [Planctomycetaceae bacterium]